MHDLKFQPPTTVLLRLKEFAPTPKLAGEREAVWCVRCLRCLRRGHLSHACTEAVTRTQEQAHASA